MAIAWISGLKKWISLVFLISSVHANRIQQSNSSDETEMGNINDLFEGDIAGIYIDALDSTRSAGQGEVFGNGVRNENARWPGGEVPFKWSNHFYSHIEQRNIIMQAMDVFHTRTCVRFIERSNEDDYIYIVPGFGCSSYVGRQPTSGKGQGVSLPSNCLSSGTIQHELMHALGFYHEQARTDRDNYVDVDWNNIAPEQKHNFEKYLEKEIHAYGQPYDFGSVMHYEKNYFAIDPSKPTLKPKPQYSTKTLGQRVGLSDIDINKINLMYNCPQKPVIQKTKIKQIESGSSLKIGETLWSNDEKLKLVMQRDGNAVVYQDSDNKVIWAASFTNKEILTQPATSLEMQADGNLVMYNSSRNAIWASETHSVAFAGSILKLNNDGSLCIFKERRCYWRSAYTELKSGRSLYRYETLWSPNRAFKLVMQADGNAVVYRDYSVVWATWFRGPQTSSKPKRGWVLRMQPDGNLVMYDTTDQPVWKSDTNSEAFAGAELRLDDDGTFCLFKNGNCVYNFIKTEVSSGGKLWSDQTLRSANQKFRLIVEENGNAIVYRDRDYKALWTASQTGLDLAAARSDPPESMTMQTDGNLVMHNSKKQVVWSSGTNKAKYEGASLRLDDDGSLCLYKGQTCIWAS